MNVFELAVIVEREVWMNDTEDWGVIGVIPKYNEDIDTYNLKFNIYGNLTLKGNMPRLDIGGTYIAKIEEKKDKKFGYGYEIHSIYQDIPTSTDEQRAYLSTLLTPIQVMEIYNVYDENDDIIGMMKDETFDYTKVKGFGEITYRNIRKKVVDNIELQEALVSLSKYGLNYNMVSKLVRIYGSASLVVQKISDNPYVLTKVDGIGFKKCDKYALEMGIEKDSEYRIEACIEYILNEEANNGHCWVDKEWLTKESKELLSIDKELIKDFIREYDKKDFIIEKEKVGLRRFYYYERDIHKSINDLLSSESEIKVDNMEERIKKAEEIQGFEFTDEQKKAIELAISQNVLIISGKAGTGKTTILKGIMKVLNPKSYHTCALSGKASQRISESTGLTSSTIHRMLKPDAETGFFYNYDNKMEYDVVVLDEASMVNNYIFSCLVKAIKKGAKFIILGDVEQLEPIGAGNVLKDLIDSVVVPKVILNKVHRQAMKSGILSTANEVREGTQFNEKGNFENRTIGELNDLHFKPFKKSSSVNKSIIKACKQYMESKSFDLMNFQVIVPLKNRGENCTKNLNQELQKIFNPEIKPTIKRNNYDFKEGDKVIQQGNNYKYGVFNGTLGRVINVNTENKSVVIDFMGVGEIEYTQEEMSQIDMAYALTVHKVQGSQFDNVVVGLDYSAYVLLSRQLVYTALTRASKLCLLICENDALIKAIKTDKSSKRNTFLWDFFKKDFTSDK